MSLITPESVWALQEALHAKAKREPTCRFHSLYDKIYRKDVLLFAWKCCRANGGAPGVDGITFKQIEARGVGDWLEELTKDCQELSQMTERRFQWKPVKTMVEEMNRTLRGWGNYFCLGAVSRAYQAVNNHARHRLRQWLNGKQASRGVRPKRHTSDYLHDKLGLSRLVQKTSNFS